MTIQELAASVGDVRRTVQQRPGNRMVSMCFLAMLCALMPASRNAFAADGPKSPAVIKDFSLRDYVGKTWSLSEAKGKPVVVAFLGVECPMVQLYAKRLQELQDEYSDRVTVIGIDSNLQDSLTEMASFARRQKISFLLLKDPGNVVADQFRAQRTPEVFLLDGDLNVRYRGRIDDQYTYGIQRPKATKHFLRDALGQVLAGEQVTTPSTEVVGCHIGRVLTPKSDSDVTYSNQISRIFQKRCVECHRAGEIAPFPLTTYDESVGWAEMIDEVTHERRMPPWHAEPKHQTYVNNARLTDDELTLIRQWVDAGAPEGDPKELPKPLEFESGWRIGEPDQIVWMSDKPFAVKARGEVRYQYFKADPGFKEDMWVQAAECRPGNRAVVHHIIVALQSDASRDRVHGRRSEWLAATAPGARPMVLPPGQAKLVPAGSKLIFQMHYTPNGTAQTDRSCIGLKFADPKTVKQRVATHQAANNRFRIPPHASSHEVKASYTFRDDGLLLSMFPHMHLRGKSFTYTAIFPNGKREVLLEVPNYDFNWQNAYILEQPKRMPKGTKIYCVAHFDNSEDNLANPDPADSVRWGDQTWEEMMIGYFDICDVDNQSRTKEFLNDVEQLDRDALVRAAAGALSSESQFMKWAESVREVMPQVDRIDWIEIQDDKMKVRIISQDDDLRRRIGDKIEIEVEGMALARIATRTDVVAYDDLSEAKGLDFRYMRRALTSSVHVPVKRKAPAPPAVLSFWSAEEAGFPEPARQLVIELAKAVSPPSKKQGGESDR